MILGSLALFKFTNSIFYPLSRATCTSGNYLRHFWENTGKMAVSVHVNGQSSIFLPVREAY